MVTRRLQISISLLVGLCFLGCGQADSSVEIDMASLLPLPTTESSQEKSDYDWAKAVEPREFSFPEDHGSHEDFRIEWWYYTGNLTASNGRRFGYQLTFFRTGVQRDTENTSRWTVRDLYTVHFAISDIESKKHYSTQKNRRAGVGLAGAEKGELKVWNGLCRIEEEDGKHRLIAEADDFSIDLKLDPGKGVVLQGNKGLSKKGAATGNASYYYSMPRMPTAGTLRVNKVSYEVIGDSWMDHEFSTSFLEEGQRGWDWLSLQLDDDTELMLYQMRRTDGTTDPYSSGTLIGSDGARTELSSSDFKLIPGKTWRSSETGANYPLSWGVEVKSLGLVLQATPAFDSQEMTTEATTGIAYWEGSIEVSGTRNQAPITGRGYLELTGYTETELGSMVIDD